MLLVFLALPALAKIAAALDKKVLSDHIKESYDLPPGVNVEVLDLSPSEVPGFDKGKVELSKGKARQVQTIYVSKDGRFYLLGAFRDLRSKPDEERMRRVRVDGAPIRGKADAPVTLIEFTDFQCPYCKAGYEILRDRIMKEYPDRVRWVYKALPLKSIHPWAESAAVAVECAKRQGPERFWKLHDVLFDRQQEIRVHNADAKIAELAKASGVEAKAFEACADGKEAGEGVDRDLREADDLGLSSTPSFLINGHLVPGANYEALKEIIEESLRGLHGPR